MPDEAPPRPLSRQETHDLSMIIKDRAKVLKSHAAHRAAECQADFERKLATIYKFDDDAVWQEAAEHAAKVVAESQAKIEQRCNQLGIPSRFAPRLELSWQGRGENALAYRRAELTRVAKATIAAMQRRAETQIERQSLDLRTQVVGMGVLSPQAKLFLESLASIDEAMAELRFEDVERRLEEEKPARRLGGYGP